MTTTALHDRIRENFDAIHARIQAACARSQRDPSEITFIAVTKYASEAAVRALYDMGHRHFGESRPQQLAARAAAFPADVRWHLIGHLQRNKADLVAPIVHRIHSVDSLRLLRKLNEVAAQADRRLSILLEVNISGESSKDGYSADAVRAEWAEITMASHLDVMGLMTMAPLAADATQTRTVFSGLRQLRDDLAQRGPWPLPELSMGMSGDFEIAIEEGATMIRIGSTLFAGCESECLSQPGAQATDVRK